MRGSEKKVKKAESLTVLLGKKPEPDRSGRGIAGRKKKSVAVRRGRADERKRSLPIQRKKPRILSLEVGEIEVVSGHCDARRGGRGEGKRRV